MIHTPSDSLSLVFNDCHSTTNEKLKQELESYFTKTGTNLNSYTVCYLLQDKENQELRISELAELLCLSTSATSRLVVKMEAETGLVVRETCEIDNRGLYVVLTQKGRDFLTDASAAVEKLIQKAL
ncbi:MarR family transcriptional regulator [Streptococcus suis]|uniref:MarR family transcriptional regulator n=1 Tax=Streptococcus suis TaxID=1307 RepID=A0A540UXF4_STRSU|nr:MarR family transcriptional regulator [Streptococcus suis]TQE89172.1 MarR family transcriptional regulator [Streptococcus suis]